MIWKCVVNLVDAGVVHARNAFTLICTIALFVDDTSSAQQPVPGASPVDQRKGSEMDGGSGGEKVAVVDHALQAVDLLVRIAGLVHENDVRWFSGERDTTVRNTTVEFVSPPRSPPHMGVYVVSSSSSLPRSEQQQQLSSADTVDSAGTPSPIDQHNVEQQRHNHQQHEYALGGRVVNDPDRDTCWLMILVQLRELLDTANVEIQARVSSALQRLLFSPPSVIHPAKLVEAFDQVLFPLLVIHENGGNTNGSSCTAPLRLRVGEGEEIRLRAVPLVAGAFLHNVPRLCVLPGFHLLWLRMVSLIAGQLKITPVDKGSSTAATSASELMRETTLETLKNLIMVMQGEGTLDRLSKDVGTNVWQLTWDVVDSCSPGTRDIIQHAFPNPNPNPPAPLLAVAAGGERFITEPTNDLVA
jgi:hypothetical protein